MLIEPKRIGEKEGSFATLPISTLPCERSIEDRHEESTEIGNHRVAEFGVFRKVRQTIYLTDLPDVGKYSK